MGFCIVTFSTYEEAQNCYFNMRFTNKISLMKDMHEFQFDENYRKQILRYIDNEYLKTKFNQEEDLAKKEEIEEFSNYSLF